MPLDPPGGKGRPVLPDVRRCLLSLMVHYSEIVSDGFKTLAENQEVTFDLKEGPKGLQAVNVRAL